ncbi:leucyl/phenylalanyl-tRNA--protein transferase [Halothiobacillus diazotrophicus]|uniref:Leucyl/phenylalanyl-tRNA--protein transferase n=1 Tax=Halothiobacillus diazotrophicus TaxID=1860122 RepID=A0A191ZH26_9GAMM|nr:leucyl/phenylalanyl-tRNA--protein transferase [Halothiobacillus diazotrophicus]ANJ67184.1 leucyl/phenylalanyl-tRNA--protein transferase [Halothiobacillus diazotrophicus]
MILPFLESGAHADPEDFPPVTQALSEPNGLLAVGGDLSLPRMIAAYRRGIFPWFSADDPILWWAPDPRTVLLPNEFHCSRTLQRWRRQDRYKVTVDQAFEAVVRGCAAPRSNQDGTWIVPAMREAFVRLHRAGVGHSVEVWSGDELVGGLFGAKLGRAAFGESMFSRAPNASKFALAAILLDGCWGEIDFLDCQFTTEHLLSLGAIEWSRSYFVRQLAKSQLDDAPTAQGIFI